MPYKVKNVLRFRLRLILMLLLGVSAQCGIVHQIYRDFMGRWPKYQFLFVIALHVASSLNVSVNAQSKRSESYVVSWDMRHWHKVHKLPPDLRIVRNGERTRSFSTDGGRTWKTMAKASTAEEPNFVWHQTLRADSIFALDPVQLLEDPVTNSVSILTSTNRQTRFIELDANSGNERWRLNFPSRDSTYDFGCIYLDGDVLHASGFVLNDPVITVSGYKIQLDISRSTGKMLGYAYSLEPSHSSKPGHIFRNDDQEYVAANIFSGTYFARFDASGQVAANQVNGSGNYDVYPTDVVRLSDGNFVVTGSALLKTQFAPWLTKVSTSFDSLWSFYGVIASADSVELQSLKSLETDDGGIVTLASSRTVPKVKAATYIHLMRFSSTGEVLWSHPYPSSGNTQGSDIVRLPDGGYAIVGSSNNNTEFYLLLLDSKFDVRQEYRWGTPERPNRLTVATLAANGDLLLGGVTNDDGLANKNYFARVKLPNAVVSQKSYAEELRVFPNPTAGRIEVSFKNPSHPRTLELIDVKGSLLRVLHIDASVSSSDAVSVDTSDLPSGLYLLRLMGDGLVAIAPLVKF